MRDFNFFRSYQKPTGHKADVKRIGLIAVICILVFVGGFYGFNVYRISLVDADMKRMEQYMKAPANVKQYKVYLKAKERLSILSSYYEVVDKINRVIDLNSRLSLDTLDKLNKAMPVEVTLENVKLNSKTMSFQGITGERLNVADYEHNLVMTGLFKDVFVNNIDNYTDISSGIPISGGYTFTINCELKEVVTP